MGIDLVEKKSSDASVRATGTVGMPLGTFFFGGKVLFLRYQYKPPPESADYRSQEKKG